MHWSYVAQNTKTTDRQRNTPVKHDAPEGSAQIHSSFPLFFWGRAVMTYKWITFRRKMAVFLPLFGHRPTRSSSVQCLACPAYVAAAMLTSRKKLFVPRQMPTAVCTRHCALSDGFLRGTRNSSRKKIHHTRR